MSSKSHDSGYEMRGMDSVGERTITNAVRRRGEVVNVYKQDDDDMAYVGKRQQLTVRLFQIMHPFDRSVPPWGKGSSVAVLTGP